MHVYIFTVACPECGRTTRTRAQSRFNCPSCDADLTLDDITIIKMEKCSLFEHSIQGDYLYPGMERQAV